MVNMWYKSPPYAKFTIHGRFLQSTEVLYNPRTDFGWFLPSTDRAKFVKFLYNPRTILPMDCTKLETIRNNVGWSEKVIFIFIKCLWIVQFLNQLPKMYNSWTFMTSSPGQEKCLWIVHILNQFQKVTENVQFMDMIDGGSKSGPEEVALYIDSLSIYRAT